MREKAFGLALAMCWMISSNHQLLASSIILPAATKFELVNGMVIVEAELDGQLANFILDTGSPMMILNEKNLVAMDSQVKSLQGSMPGNWKHIEEFAWAGVRRFDLKAMTTDISVLEALTERPIAGLIGYDFLEDVELVLDFDQLVVMLVPVGATANLEGWTLKSELPFTFAGHLPVIEAKIGEVTLRFGLDTGANINLLNQGKVKELDANLMELVVDAGLLGMAGNSNKTSAADILETEIGGLVFNQMRFVFADISHLPNLVENGVDGLLGFPFFQAGKFSLNYSTRTISIWE